MPEALNLGSQYFPRESVHRRGMLARQKPQDIEDEAFEARALPHSPKLAFDTAVWLKP